MYNVYSIREENSEVLSHHLERLLSANQLNGILPITWVPVEPCGHTLSDFFQWGHILPRRGYKYICDGSARTFKKCVIFVKEPNVFPIKLQPQQPTTVKWVTAKTQPKLWKMTFGRKKHPIHSALFTHYHKTRVDVLVSMQEGFNHGEEHFGHHIPARYFSSDGEVLWLQL